MFRLVVIGAVFGVVGSILAQTKGRSQVLWFVLCGVFPLSIIAILLLPALVARGYTKKCIHCAEIIKEEATFCKHCGMGNP